MFVLDSERVERTPKEDAFLRKISTELIRSRCLDQSSLLLEIYSSLDALLLEQGHIEWRHLTPRCAVGRHLMT